MTDTRAAAVAALAETGYLDITYDEADSQLHAILASPEHRAALLAVLLTPERLTEGLDGIFDDGTDRWRLVPMTEDGGLSVTTPASWFAAAIIRRLTTTEEPADG